MRASGAEVYLASTLDGPLGIAAARARRRGARARERAACGLATLALFAGEFDVLVLEDGRIAVPTGPGLGVEGRADRGAAATAVAARSRAGEPVAGARDTRSSAAGQRGGQALAERRELRVALPDDQRDGHRELAQAVPQRRHRPGAEPAQRGRQRRRGRCGGCRARGGRGDRRRVAGEQRLGAPAVGEGLDRRALERRRELRRPPRAARRARPSSSMPGGGGRRGRGARSARARASATCSAMRPPSE